MPKSQIIIDVVEENVTLEKSLSRLLILAKDIQNPTLEKWAQCEINGYKEREDIPEYRVVGGCYLKYNGFNGNYQVSNVTLSNSWLDGKLVEKMANYAIFDGIKTIEETIKKGETSFIDRTDLAEMVHKKSDGGITCVALHQIIPLNVFVNICAELKIKLISVLYELEKTYGCLDDLGIDITKTKASVVKNVNNEVNKIVYNINITTDEKKKEPWYAKVAWGFVIPLATTVIGAILVAILGF